TKLLGNLADQLTRHSDAKARLAAEPARIPNAVEEMLRYDTSTHMMARTLARDVELHGRRLEAGRKVALLLASANRDERRRRDPAAPRPLSACRAPPPPPSRSASVSTSASAPPSPASRPASRSKSCSRRSRISRSSPRGSCACIRATCAGTARFRSRFGQGEG